MVIELRNRTNKQIWTVPQNAERVTLHYTEVVKSHIGINLWMDNCWLINAFLYIKASCMLCRLIR